MDSSLVEMIEDCGLEPSDVAHVIKAAQKLGRDEKVTELERQRKVLQNLLANYACKTGAGANDPDVIEALVWGCEDDVPCSS